MTWEIAFKFVVLFAQLAAVLMVGAWIADRIVQPILEKRHMKKHGNNTRSR